MTDLVKIEGIEKQIFLLRGKKIMLSHDLANLYQVPTKVLMQAVKRNLDRFPDDFMFQLTWTEAQFLTGDPDSRSQSVTLNRGYNIKYLPYAFSEQGVAMLSGVLKSHRAIRVNIEIMRAFVRLKEMLSHHKELAKKLAELEQKRAKELLIKDYNLFTIPLTPFSFQNNFLKIFSLIQ